MNLWNPKAVVGTNSGKVRLTPYEMRLPENTADRTHVKIPGADMFRFAVRK